MFVAQKVRFKNFRSYGNTFTEVDLTRNRTTVITAKNGAGKTSILMAITFALFGKVTGINKNTLINDINGKDCLVEIECENKGQKICVRRGIKPAIFDIEIDGVLVDQSASSRDYQKWFEEVVLGFNLNSFNQIVSINGGTYTPFFLLTSGKRREMVEDLLSITVFSKMYMLHQGTLAALKEQLKDVDRDTEMYQETIDSLKKALDDIVSRDEDLVKFSNEKISRYEDRVNELKQQLIQYETEFNETAFSAIQLTKLEKKQKSIEDIEKDLKRNINNNEKFIKFLSENSVCPTCANDLTDEFKHDHICKKQDKNDEIETKLTELANIAKKNQDNLNTMRDAQYKVIDLKNKMKSISNEIQINLENIRLEKESQQKASFLSEIGIKSDIIEKTALLEKSKESKRDYLIQKQYLELQTAILKDSGIKSRIINQIIPKMKKDINQFLTYLDLFVTFDVDENFNETIYRRFKDPVSYVNLSAGERARVDIALLFTWREIAKLKNSLTCNLLFLDEAFDDALDDVGLDLFVNMLKEQLQGTNVFLISHRPEVVDKFDSNMRIEKRGNFSYIL